MLSDYLQRFSGLRTDQATWNWSSPTRRRAPHKPLLLLAVLDQFAEGTITDNLILPSDDLVDLFAVYWARVVPPPRRSSIALPFFALRSEGFWHLIAKSDQETILANTPQIRTMTHLLKLVLGARLDDELYAFCQVAESREQLRTILLETYFVSELLPALIEQGAINVEAFRYSLELFEKARRQELQEQPTTDSYGKAVRDQGFRRAVVSAYERRCAFCGIRVVTAEGHTAVDAAHIIPWSVSYNDDLGNGMALCRLCHWTFDEGLLGVTQEYSLKASPQLSGNGNIAGHLSMLAGRKVFLPDEHLLWPAMENLAWHHDEVFRKR